MMREERHQWVFGHHSVRSLLTHRPSAVIQLCLSEQHKTKSWLADFSANLPVTIEWRNKSWFDAQFGASVHQGIAVFAKENQPTSLEDHLCDLGQGPWSIVVLDRVQDPRNLGGIIRTALALGASGVIVPKHQAVGLTATVRKASVGAAECLPFIQVNNLRQALNTLQEHNVWCVGFDGHSKMPLETVPFERPTALVMGAEGAGLRPKVKSLCDQIVHIPMKGAMESLNVGVALGIALYQWQQQVFGHNT